MTTDTVSEGAKIHSFCRNSRVWKALSGEGLREEWRLHILVSLRHWPMFSA